MKKIFALLAVASVFTMANAQEEIAGVKYDDGIAKKWELKFDGGYTNDFCKDRPKVKGMMNGNESWGVGVGVGYNFTSNWYVGLNSGFYGEWGSVKTEDGSNVIPALLDVVYRWNLGTAEKWSIFLEGRGGYMFNLHDDVSYHKKDYSLGNYIYADAQAGVFLLPCIRICILGLSGAEAVCSDEIKHRRCCEISFVVLPCPIGPRIQVSVFFLEKDHRMKLKQILFLSEPVGLLHRYRLAAPGANGLVIVFPIQDHHIGRGDDPWRVLHRAVLHAAAAPKLDICMSFRPVKEQIRHKE